MARSATNDPLTKFRFTITVVSIDLSINGLASTIGGLSGQNTFAKNNLAILARAGFSEITLPKATVNEINYRENLDYFPRADIGSKTDHQNQANYYVLR